MTEKQNNVLYNLYNELDEEKDYKEKLYIGEALVKLGLAYYTYNREYDSISNCVSWRKRIKLDSPLNKTLEEIRNQAEYDSERKRQHEKEVASEYHAIYDNQMGQF